MVRRKTALKIRKTHRYLGIFIGIQFLMWTISGMYFSWTDIDEIHGNQFLNPKYEAASFRNLISPDTLSLASGISSLQLREIAGRPFYWINGSILLNAQTGEPKKGITEEEAVKVAEKHMMEGLVISKVEKINDTGKHHEYRGGALPAYVISYESPEEIKAYVSASDGSFRSLRHRNWRWFDFLWMTHTMDYEGRDNFNTLLLRAFSLLGLLTVLSGFVLWYISSPTIIKIRKKIGDGIK